jgi:hypothetical protein
LPLLLSAIEKQQIPFYSFWLDQSRLEQSTTLEASLLTITPLMQFPIWEIFGSQYTKAALCLKNVTLLYKRILAAAVNEWVIDLYA